MEVRWRNLPAVERCTLVCLLLVACALHASAQGAQLSNFTLSSNSVVGGVQVTGTLTLNQAAPTGGASVTVTASNPNAFSFTSPVVIQQGQTTASFNIQTSTVNYQATYTLTAGYNNGQQQASIQLWPTNLHVTDIVMPKTLKLLWGVSASGNFLLYRNGVQIASLPNTTQSYNDQYNFNSGDTILYELYDSANGSMQNENQRISADKIIAYAQTATQDQVVDSRIDPRYSTIVYQNFPFGNRTYRGGLFAGFASDNSGVGRTFVMFPFTAPTGGSSLRCADVNLYQTWASTTGGNSVTATIGCQSTGTAWSASSINWSNAPAITPSSAYSTASITFNPKAATASWFNWNMSGPIASAIANHAALFSAALASTNETQNGWIYFAKFEYNASDAPTLTYGQAAPTLVAATASPTTVHSGGSSTVTATVNGLGPGDSATVQVADWQGGTYHTRNVTVTGLTNAIPVYLPTVGQNGGYTVSVTMDVTIGLGFTVVYP